MAGASTSNTFPFNPIEFFLELPDVLQEILKKGKLQSPRDILVTNDNTLLTLGATPEGLKELKSLAIKFYCNIEEDSNANQLMEDNTKWQRLSVGCSDLDQVLGGGFLNRGITEISGEAGSGKTQLALQICLMAQLSPTHGGILKNVAVITTEKSFPMKRCHELSEQYKEKYSRPSNGFMDGILISQIRNIRTVKNSLLNEIPKLIEQHNVGVIIIDSIGALFRSEENVIERANQMRILASTLLDLVNKYNCFAICLNQVTSVNDQLFPCLGIAWSNLIRTRIQISKCSDNPDPTLRKFELLFSPEKPPSSCSFALTSAGIVNYINWKTF